MDITCSHFLLCTICSPLAIVSTIPHKFYPTAITVVIDILRINTMTVEGMVVSIWTAYFRGEEEWGKVQLYRYTHYILI